MNSLLFILVLIFSLKCNHIQSITWQSGGWAYACDFAIGVNDLTNSLTTASQCGPKCLATSSCTHFTWTNYKGGTCYMKFGKVSQSDAHSTTDNTMVCGILKCN